MVAQATNPRKWKKSVSPDQNLMTFNKYVKKFKCCLNITNLKNLTTWMSVGADVENGQYAMLGARIGCYATTLGSTDVNQISDLGKMKDVYAEHLQEHMVNLDEDLRYTERACVTNWTYLLRNLTQIRASSSSTVCQHT